jgi:hypothetical protein
MRPDCLVVDFHLDQNAPPRIAIELRRIGHTAVTAYDLQMQRALDAEHLLRAWQASRVLVSRDLDYRYFVDSGPVAKNRMSNLWSSLARYPRPVLRLRPARPLWGPAEAPNSTK